VQADHILLVPNRQDDTLEIVPSQLPEQQLQKWAPGNTCHRFGSGCCNTPQA
jgi:hypothetical protein